MPSRFPPGAFDRQDESPDAFFYSVPRLVNHIDDYAVAAVGEAYRTFLSPGGEYLDLMSSWVSHFPVDFPTRRLVGLGMNAVELSQNPRLDEYVVHDLNLNPVLPYADARFDGVVICVSVQYLVRPQEVFAEIGRVLKPGAPVIVTYSNRCFPTKAVRVWQMLNDEGHGQLVASYIADTDAFGPVRVYDVSPRTTLAGVPDDQALRARIARGEVYTDPVYAVVAHKRRDDR